MNRREFLAGAAALPVSLALGRSGLAAPRGGSRALALVTADLESHVVVLRTSDWQVLTRIRTAPGPRSIESVDAGLAVAAHTEYGSLSIVDALDVRSELPGFAAPRYTAVHPSRGIAYVTDSVAKEVVALDVGRAKAVSRARVPGPARHVSVSRDGKVLWTALGSKAERLAVLDLADARRPRLVRTIAPPFLAHDVVFAPDGRHVWVTSGAGHRVALYRADTREIVRVLEADRAPQHVAFVGGLAFVSSGDDGTVRVHRLNGDLIRRVAVPLGSYNVTHGGGSVVTPSLSRGTAALLDDRGRVLAVRRIARAAHDACVVSGI